MNKLLIGMVSAAAGAILMLAAPVASARDNVNWSVNVAIPGAVYPSYSAPIAYGYAPVYSRPAPVYVQPAPVYYAPQPAYVQPVRVYGSGYDRGYHPRHHGHHGYQGHHGHHKQHHGHHGRHVNYEGRYYHGR